MLLFFLIVHVCFTSLVIQRSMLHSRLSLSGFTLRLAVDVKHAGRTQSIVVEDTGSVLALKAELSKVTGVPLGECCLIKSGLDGAQTCRTYESHAQDGHSQGACLLGLRCQAYRTYKGQRRLDEAWARRGGLMEQSG
jgi:hypothetical protein